MDDVVISKLINVNSSFEDSDGGSLTIEAVAGSVTITGKVTATGGGLSRGGNLTIYGGTDVTISETVDVSGGDFDGGSLDVTSGRDITLNRSVTANSESGAGFGGEIRLVAGRDLALSGVSAAKKTTLETNGHTSSESFSGDGGTQNLVAGRDLFLNTNTRLIGIGSQPDGIGSEMFMQAGGNFFANGEVSATALGGQGSGGSVEVSALGNVQVGSSASFSVTANAGGSLNFLSSGNTDFAGTANASGSTTQGSGGVVSLDSKSNTVLSGTLFVNGAEAGRLEVSACSVTLAPLGTLKNTTGNGVNKIQANSGINIVAGSQMLNTTGANLLVYGGALPVVAGTVSPAPQLIHDPTLGVCGAGCGDGVVTAGEQCDDRNTANGDCCSSSCQFESSASVCRAATGVCDPPEYCIGTSAICPIDAFQSASTTCRPSAGQCDVTETCTGAAASCPADAVVPNNTPCNDGLFCNGSDGCSSGLCSTHAGSSCQGPDGDGNCAESCDESTDSCSASDPNGSTCSDGDACSVGDQCLVGVCVPGTPPTCEDGNPCTTDGCDPATGKCVFSSAEQTCSENAPVARFTTSDVVGFVGLPLGFDAFYSTDPQNSVLSYVWDFGDGSPAGHQQEMSKVYTVANPYTVKLTVRDDGGLQSSTQRRLEVLPADQIGLFNAFMDFTTRFDRTRTATDKITLRARVNIGDAQVVRGTMLALEIAGQRFSATLGGAPRASLADSAKQNWKVKSSTVGQAAGGVDLRVTIKKADLGLGFHQLGAIADGFGSASIFVPVRLEIGDHSFEIKLDSFFDFNKAGTSARGEGTSQ